MPSLFFFIKAGQPPSFVILFWHKLFQSLTLFALIAFVSKISTIIGFSHNFALMVHGVFAPRGIHSGRVFFSLGPVEE